MEFISVILVLIWARLPVARVHAAAQQSMGQAGRNGRKRSCAQPLTARTALVSFPQQQSRPPSAMPPFLLLVIIVAGIGIDVLMHVMVHHAADDGLIHFVAFMLTFFALRKMRHALESRL
jgi:hypothetical protein